MQGCVRHCDRCRAGSVAGARRSGRRWTQTPSQELGRLSRCWGLTLTKLGMARQAGESICCHGEPIRFSHAVVQAKKRHDFFMNIHAYFCCLGA